ncbi:MAG: glycosyltransferase family 9 protein, partial [Thermomicrobiaceae bacterium]
MPLSMLSNSKPQNSQRDLTGRIAGFADWLLRPGNPPAFTDAAQVRNIVIIKPCCLGDMLMATPAIRAIDQQFPNAEITIVTDDWTRPAIETSPRIDRLILYPDSSPMRAAVEMAVQMRRFKFDVGVSLDRSPATALALRLAGIPIRAGVDSASRGIGLTHRTIPEPDQHETDLYLSVVNQLGISDSGKHPEFQVPDAAIQRAHELLPGGSNHRLVVIHPGGAVNPGVAMLEKRWPATSYGELAGILSADAGATIVLTGQETDRNAVETAKQFTRSPVIDLCGQLSLNELAAVAQQSALFVGNDSGVSHLASAVGTPVVALFGPTNPRRYAPLGRRTRICAPEASWSIPEYGDLRVRS